MRRDDGSGSERLFWDLGRALMARDGDVMEGTIMNGRCLRVGKEFLALVDYKGSGLVVKLPAQRVAELIAAGVGQPFAPAGRVFKEWVSIPTPDRRRWDALLREGVAHAKLVRPGRAEAGGTRRRREPTARRARPAASDRPTAEGTADRRGRRSARQPG